MIVHKNAKMFMMVHENVKKQQQQQTQVNI